MAEFFWSLLLLVVLVALLAALGFTTWAYVEACRLWWRVHRRRDRLTRAPAMFQDRPLTTEDRVTWNALEAAFGRDAHVPPHERPPHVPGSPTEEEPCP